MSIVRCQQSDMSTLRRQHSAHAVEVVHAYEVCACGWGLRYDMSPGILEEPRFYEINMLSSGLITTDFKFFIIWIYLKTEKKQ